MLDSGNKFSFCWILLPFSLYCLPCEQAGFVFVTAAVGAAMVGRGRVIVRTRDLPEAGRVGTYGLVAAISSHWPGLGPRVAAWLSGGAGGLRNLAYVL